MNEEEFINKSLDAVSRLVGEIEKLHEEGTAKTECYVKASELVFWLQLYQDENFNFAGEIEDE